MLKLIIFGLISATNLVRGFDFSYDDEGDNGPSNWVDKYPICAGQVQSPVDIDIQETQAQELPALRFSGFSLPARGMTLENNGLTVVATISDKTCVPTISGGPLGNSSFTFQHLTFHWGPNYSEGSEHTINGVAYALEMQLVFRSAENRLAIMAVFFQETSANNRNYASIFKATSSLGVNETAQVSPVPSLSSLLPRDHQTYYTYPGSLTAPPCSEIVTWLVFETPMVVGRKQLNMLRNLDADSAGNKISHNFRPVQPLNGRQIFSVQDSSLLNIDDSLVRDQLCRLNLG